MEYQVGLYYEKHLKEFSGDKSLFHSVGEKTSDYKRKLPVRSAFHMKTYR